MGWYRGLGLSSEPGFLGRQFFKFRVDEGELGYWEVDVFRDGYNPFRGFYANGDLREEGECLVVHSDSESYPDNSEIRWGRYYKPDGTVGATVTDGTGFQRYWYPDGQIAWEAEYENYQRLHYTKWRPDGTVQFTSRKDAAKTKSTDPHD